MTAEEKRRAEILIDNDFDHAKDGANRFIVTYLEELTFRCQSLDGAMRKFTTFLKLPPHTSMLSAVYDLAFTVISTACPLLGVGKALAASGKAIEVAAALGSKQAIVLKVVQTAGEWAPKLNKGKETVEKVAKEVKQLKGEPEGMSELKKLDVAKGPLREMLENANKAIAIWGTVIDLLDDEKMYRKLDIEVQRSETMQQMAVRLLPTPLDPMNEHDIDELELLFLWQIFKGYSNHFTMVRTDRGYGVVDISIDGLNDNQEDTLVDMFGPDAPRGKTFYMPPAPNIYILLGMWGVPWRTDVMIRDNIGNKI